MFKGLGSWHIRSKVWIYGQSNLRGLRSQVWAVVILGDTPKPGRANVSPEAVSVP